MWSCNITGLLYAKEMDAYLLGLSGAFSEATPKWGDVSAFANHSLSFLRHDLGLWMVGSGTMHSLPSMVCRRQPMMVRGVTRLVGIAITQLLLLKKANELINKRRIYYLNAYRRKIHTGERWKRAFTFSPAVRKRNWNDMTGCLVSSSSPGIHKGKTARDIFLELIIFWHYLFLSKCP